MPIWLRITAPDEHFKKGPFTLGAWGRPISCVAMLWVCFACVLFILPQVLPVTYQVSAGQGLTAWATAAWVTHVWGSKGKQCSMGYSMGYSIVLLQGYAWVVAGYLLC